MDVPDVTIGNTIAFPVHHPGALCYVGDAHAAQGQGELCGVALEIAAAGVFRFEVIEGRAIAWPRISSPDRIMTVGSAKPMEDAARIANSELVRWMVDEYGFELLDAYRILSQAGGLYVGTWSTRSTRWSPAARSATCRPNREDARGVARIAGARAGAVIATFLRRCATSRGPGCASVTMTSSPPR